MNVFKGVHDDHIIVIHCISLILALCIFRKYSFVVFLKDLNCKFHTYVSLNVRKPCTVKM